MTKQLTIEECSGSLSTGTIQLKELIPRCMAFLQNVKEKCEIVSEVDELQNKVDEFIDLSSDEHGDDASFVFDETICNLMNEIAPDYFTFCSHPTDGADFGFWMYEDAIESVYNDLQMSVQHIQSMQPELNYEEIVKLIECMNYIDSLSEKEK